MKKRRIAVIAIALVALIAYGMAEHDMTTVSNIKAPLRPLYVAAEGKVEAMPGYDINLGTGELNGRVTKILFKEGDLVKQDQVVAVLENGDLQAQVKQSELELVVAKSRLTELESGARQAEILSAAAELEGATAQMANARNQLTRNRELFAQHLVPQSILDENDAAFKALQAAVEDAAQRKRLLIEGPKPETVQLYRDQVRLAQAALDYSRQRLAKTIIHSPITGTVVERYLDEGEGVTPEIPILAIVDLSKVWVNAEVDETDVGKVHLGDAVQVHCNAYPDKTYTGSVREIANYAGERKIRPNNPVVNLGLKIVQVKIELLQQTQLLLGMTVDVRITPAEILSERPHENFD